MVVGELADRRRAALPIVAALGGVAVPALIALTVGWGTPGIERAWAIPVATDIAFALGVLAITGSRLPSSARVFLLSLAVVDDLVAIVIIAVVFTTGLALGWLGVALACLAVYAVAQRRRITTPLLYVPLALLTWYAIHETGVHATLAGVALGLLTRVRADTGERESPAARLEHRIQPFSAGVCVPLFAFFAAGVPLSGGVLGALGTNRIALAVIAGLLVGKVVGIFGVSWLAIRSGLAQRPRHLGKPRHAGAVGARRHRFHREPAHRRTGPGERRRGRGGGGQGGGTGRLAHRIGDRSGPAGPSREVLRPAAGPARAVRRLHLRRGRAHLSPPPRGSVAP